MNPAWIGFIVGLLIGVVAGYFAAALSAIPAKDAADQRCLSCPLLREQKTRRATEALSRLWPDVQ